MNASQSHPFIHHGQRIALVSARILGLCVSLCAAPSWAADYTGPLFDTQ